MASDGAAPSDGASAALAEHVSVGDRDATPYIRRAPSHDTMKRLAARSPSALLRVTHSSHTLVQAAQPSITRSLLPVPRTLVPCCPNTEPYISTRRTRDTTDGDDAPRMLRVGALLPGCSPAVAALTASPRLPSRRHHRRPQIRAASHCLPPAACLRETSQ